MDQLGLNEKEIDFYFDIFDRCNIETCGSLSKENVEKLLSCSGLNKYIIDNILELSKNPNSNYFSRSNFFLALKFVALAQNGYEISQAEILKNDVPLPHFDELSLEKFKITSCENVDTNQQTAEFKMDEHSFCSFSDMKSKKSSNSLGSHFPPASNHVLINKKNMNNLELKDNSSENKDLIQYECEEDELGLLTKQVVEQPMKLINSHDKKSKKCHNKQLCDPNYNSTIDQFSYLKTSSSTTRSSSSSSFDSNSSSNNNNLYNNQVPTTIENFDGTNLWNYYGLIDHVPNKSWNSNIGTHLSSNQDMKKSSFSNSSTTNRNSIHNKLYNSKQLNNLNSFDLLFAQNSKYPELNKEYKKKLNKLRGSFTFYRKRELDYALQFDELSINNTNNNGERNSKRIVNQSEVAQLFITQYNITSQDFDQIWHLADVNQDDYLDRNEFCLASHLAHLYGHQGLSLKDAITITLDYIASNTSIYLPKKFIDNFYSNSTFLRKNNSETKIYANLTMNSYSLTRSDSCDNLLDSAKSVYHQSDQNYLLTSKFIESHLNSLNSDQIDNNNNDKQLMKNLFNLDHNLSFSSSESSSSSSHSCTSSDSSVSSSNSSSSSSSSISSLSRNENYSNKEFDSINCDLSNHKTNKYLRIHRNINPIYLLSTTTGRRISSLTNLSNHCRRRLLGLLINQAKSVNHTLLRLNNELENELAELNDQRVNLSAQLQHLGLYSL